jgi:hypothetical protein
MLVVLIKAQLLDNFSDCSDNWDLQLLLLADISL